MLEDEKEIFFYMADLLVKGVIIAAGIALTLLVVFNG